MNQARSERAAVVPPADQGVRAELARLLGSGSPTRRLLRRRVEVLVGLGALVGVLHLAAGRAGGVHVALTAALASLVPVLAPVCFVPVVFSSERGGQPASVVAFRLGTVAVLGAIVAGVHLGVWAVLAGLTSSLGPPSAGDVVFSAVVVALTAVVATAAYQAPRQRRWSGPAAVGAVLLLEVAAFVSHGLLLTPPLAEVRRHLGGGALGLEVATTLGALLAVALLFRHEVRDGAARAAPAPAPASCGPGSPGPR